MNPAEPQRSLARISVVLRSPAVWIFVLVIAAEFFLFDQYGARRHTAVFPRWHDQVQYLSESYTGHEFARSRGIVAGLLNALTNSSAQGTLHDFYAIFVFFFAGPSRSAALSVNLFALIAWQIALFVATARMSGSRPLALASAMLPLALVGPWQNIPGSAYDFRLDHLAMCSLGITAAVGMMTNGFRSYRAVTWFGVAVGVTVVTRFLTGTYFVLIFAGLGLWILLGPDRKPRLLQLLRAGLISAAIAGPFLWLNYNELREYYWIGHYVGPESAIRNPNMGLGRSLRFVLEQLGVRHLGTFIGILVLAAAAAFAVVRTRTQRIPAGRRVAPTPSDDGQGRPSHSIGRSWWMVGVIFLASPMLILTLHPQKSEVVVSALVPGVIVLGVALWEFAARRTLPIAEWIISGAAVLVTIGVFARSQRETAYPPSVQEDIRRVNTLADQIFTRSQAAGLKPPRISVDYVTDAFDAHAFRVIVYERKRVWIPFDIRLPTGIGEPADALVMERLKESDFVFLTENDAAGVYPFDKKLATLRPKLREWCDINLRGVERFTLLGRPMVLYQRREIPFP